MDDGSKGGSSDVKIERDEELLKVGSLHTRICVYELIINYGLQAFR